MHTAFVFLFVLSVTGGTVQLVYCNETTAETLKPTIRKTEIPRDHRYFLHHIFRKYGNNGFISFEGFEHLLESLGLGHLKFNSSHSLSHHHTDNGEFQEMHDSLHIHEHGHLRASRNADTEDTGKNEEQLDALLKKHDEVMFDYSEMKIPSRSRCLSPQELLVVYGLHPDHRLSLSPLGFLHICPAIVYELDQRSCSDHYDPVEEPTVKIITPEQKQASWIYATAAVTLLSISGLLSVAVVPFFQRTFFTHLLNFLVALAVGTLCGDALLHLLPHALLSHDKNDSELNAVLRSGVAFLVIALFFFAEALMKAMKNNQDKKLLVKENSHYTSVDLASYVKEEELNMSVEVKTAELQQTSHQHGHSHKFDSISSVAVMVITGDALHNLTDGLAIGAAFSGGVVPGFATTVAVFTHELPHELGDFAVLLQSGMTVKQALFYNIVSSVLSFIGTYTGLWLGNFNFATQWIYAVTAGSFIYIALADLIPEMNRTCTSGLVNISHIFLQLCGILSGGAIMCTIAVYEEDLHNIFS